jgi:hypothetical protein
MPSSGAPRDRRFADSLLEGDGFEPSVPLPATAPAINFPEEGIRSPRSESTRDLAMARTQSRASPGRWRGCASRQSGCGRAPKSRAPRLAPRRRPGRKAELKLSLASPEHTDRPRNARQILRCAPGDGQPAQPRGAVPVPLRRLASSMLVQLTERTIASSPQNREVPRAAREEKPARFRAPAASLGGNTVRPMWRISNPSPG